jgi:hypothetical protein
MKSKRPYRYILKNLFHEQATEIIPFLFPEYQITQAIDIELATIKTTPLEHAHTDMEQGLTELVLPGAQITGVMQTEWIEHSGNFERIYRFQNAETSKPSYLVVEVQTEPEDTQLPARLLRTFTQVYRYADQDVAELQDEDDEELPDDDAEEEEDIVENERKTAASEQLYYVYPTVLCLFPQHVPANIRDTFMGQVLMEFNFIPLCMWEKDARELLNTHVSAAYFLLPVMKNTDPSLLGLAIEELAQKFHHDEKELGRHLTGLHLLLQRTELLSEQEKLIAQQHLQRFAHLIKSVPDEEDA